MNPFQWFSQYIFDPFFYHPFVNLLVAFTKLYELLHIPGALGLGIITLTAVIRLLLHPFFDQQIQTSKKMQDIKPHLDKLTAKHKSDPKKLQEEQMRLYREAGINPAAGCLFVIVQMPVFIALYQALSLFLTHGTSQAVINNINKVLYFSALKIQTLDPWLLGFNLALSPSKAGQWHYYLIPLITAYLQYLQAVATMQPTAKTEEKDKDKKTSSSEDFQKAMQTQMKYVFPLMIGWFSYTLPVGLSLYWNIFSLFSIIHYKRAHQNK